MPASELSPCCSGQTGSAPQSYHKEAASEVSWRAALVRFRRAWDNYSLATGLSEKAEEVQVATMLTVVGEEAREVFSTFAGWEHEGDSKKIGPVLAKFEAYCEPRKNIPFERYRFNRRCQEPGESNDQYRTSLRKLAGGCDFESIEIVWYSASETARPERDC